MRAESLLPLLVWTIPGIVGLIGSLLMVLIAKRDERALASDDPLQLHLARKAVRDEWSRVFVQVVILVVSALSVALSVPMFAPGTPAGVLIRWAWVVAMELISAGLCAGVLYDLRDRRQVDRLAGGPEDAWDVDGS